MNSVAFFALFAGLVSGMDAMVPNHCMKGYSGARDVALYTIPYTFEKTISVVGNFGDLKWNEDSPSPVKLSGKDNTVGTTRSYILPSSGGVRLHETLQHYHKSKNLFNEVFTTAPYTLKELHGLKVYVMRNELTVKPFCHGMATQFNFTEIYCASDVKLAQQYMTGIHTIDAQTAGKMLGGKNFTSCDSMVKQQAVQAKTGGAQSVKPIGAGVSVAAAVFASALLFM